MSFIKWIYLLSSILFLAGSADAQEHKVGFTGGTAQLYGDNTSSDAGGSLGLNYEMAFNPVMSLGMEGIYQRLSGESWVHDPTSIFQGLHKFDTSFLMTGLFTRLKAPIRQFQPYLSAGTGLAMWFPSENYDTDSLPMESKVSWSVSPFVSMGTGVTVPLGSNWSIDVGVKGHFFFSDELDNHDARYVTGKSSGNDYSIQTGISIVYRIGGQPEPVTEQAPEIIRQEPQPTPPPVIIQEETAPEPEEIEEALPQEPVMEIEEPETDSAVEDTVEPTLPEPAEPSIIDIPETEPEPVSPPLVPMEEPTVIIPPPPVQQQPVRRPFHVHVASFPTTEEAENNAASLISEGYRTRVMSVDRVEIGIWFRVYVGPYRTRSEAERVAERLMQAGLSDYAAVVELEE